MSLGDSKTGNCSRSSPVAVRCCIPRLSLCLQGSSTTSPCVAGCRGQHAHVDRETVQYLRQAAAAGVGLIGMCTGVFELARAGLLTGAAAVR